VNITADILMLIECKTSLQVDLCYLCIKGWKRNGSNWYWM